MDWVNTYAAALQPSSGPDVDLSEEEAAAILDLARLVARGTERRNAPLASYLAGKFVLDQSRAGVPVAEAVAGAMAAAERLLANEGEGEPGY